MNITFECIDGIIGGIIIQQISCNFTFFSSFCVFEFYVIFIGLISQSEQMLLRAFAIFSKWNGRKHVVIALTLQDLGRLYSLYFVPDR